MSFSGFSDAQKSVSKRFLENVSAQNKVRQMGLKAFLQMIFVNVGIQWNEYEYQNFIIRLLEDITESSREYRKLAISMPPRHGKSTILTIGYMAWRLICDSKLRILIACFNSDLAENFSGQVRRIVEDYIVLDRNKTALGEWHTADGGIFKAVGVGGAVVGRGFDIIGIDDPIGKSADSMSETFRVNVYNWYRRDILTRMEPGCIMLYVMTRWHEADLMGKIMDSPEKDEWKMVNLPAIAENNDPIGRNPGEALCPERFSIEELLKNRATDPRTFNALYQGHPSMGSGNIFKRDWWRFYYTNPMNPPPPVVTLMEDGILYTCLQRLLPSKDEWDNVMSSWDCSFKDTPGCDMVSGQVWMLNGADYYFLDHAYGLMSFTATRDAITDMNKKWNGAIRGIIVEDKANGSAIISELRDYYNIIPVEPHGGKIPRANAATVPCRAGHVYLPHPTICPWIEEWIAVMSAFPSGEHDDPVDSFSQLYDNMKSVGYIDGKVDFELEIMTDVERENAEFVALQESLHAENR